VTIRNVINMQNIKYSSFVSVRVEYLIYFLMFLFTKKSACITNVAYKNDGKWNFFIMIVDGLF
jgi:hypothetical protein